MASAPKDKKRLSSTTAKKTKTATSQPSNKAQRKAQNKTQNNQGKQGASHNAPPPPPEGATEGAQAWASFLADWTKISQDFWTTAVQKYTETDWLRVPLDPYNLRGAWSDFVESLSHNPEKLQDAQTRLMEQYSALWTETMKRMEGLDYKDLVPYDPSDKRFKSEKWHEILPFDVMRQSYLIASEWIRDMVHDHSKELDEVEARKIAFFTEQTLNALSPSNFAITNPEVMEETVKTGGQNLLKGFQNLINDMKRSKQLMPQIKTADETLFKPGGNIAVTRGDVVYRNAMIELIQYAPATQDVYKTPLLIAPPWINKYYILDLKPENSLIKWAVDQGHQVFVISWVNPDRSLADKGFDAYMDEGILAALDAVLAISGVPKAHVTGYCIGGTLLAMTLAWMKANKQADKVATATFLTTLLDFEHAGDLTLFVDEEQIKTMEQTMRDKGYLDSEALKSTFSLLRSNDLIWSFVVNNYLMGKEPLAFDLLFWNNDSTNLPAKMHSYYLRHMYLQNDLVKPNKLSLHGTPIDLRTIDTASYFLSAREDHIAPWAATYAGARILGNHKHTRFTLAGSGHIAGVVNPPAKNKYGYWTNNTALPDQSEAWLSKATYHEGSWWPHWHEWLTASAPDKIAAPKATGSKSHPALCPAPGTYIFAR